MTEEEIISGCRQGRAKHQRELVLRYSPMLMTVARRYTPDEAMAKDILQDAFIRVFRYFDTFEKGTGSFEGWLRRIVVTTALKRMNRAAFRHEHAAFDDLPEQGAEPDVYARLGAEALLALIRQLPEGYRQIFNLAIIEGYRHEEIGEMLGISAATSRSQLARARQRLQEMIIKQETMNHHVAR
jgi:RNA polymerase sigma-70 factor (ECF subfamily)